MFFNIPHVFVSENYGEKKVFNKLTGIFSHKRYFALHSVGLSKHQRKMAGEADFVLITDFGIFCLEVKGGSVERTKEGKWKYTTYESDESPFKQAEGAIYPIQETLSQNDNARRNKFIIGWGVIFVDVEFNDQSVEWSPEQICTASRLNYDFENYLIQLGEFYKNRLKETKNISIKDKINNNDIEWVLKCLRPEISHVSLRQLNESKAEILRLEEKQSIIVDQLTDDIYFQSIIDGGPGTGKTIILKEVIERLDKKNKILLICYNAQLSDFLKFQLAKNKNVDVFHFHSLMEYYCKLVGLNTKRTGNDNQYYDQLLPENFENSIIQLLDQDKLESYDWLLIDEAQDFLTKKYFTILMDLIKGVQETKKFVVAIDSGIQSGVYKNLDHNFLEELKQNINVIPFKRNFRNPRVLARRACSIVNLPKPVTARMLPSPPVVVSTIDEANLLKNLNIHIKQLLNKGIDVSEITILTFKNRKNTILRHQKSIAGKHLLDMKINSAWSESKQSYLKWSTIPSFKGLENEYIIMIEADLEELDDWSCSVIYVAMTRAKTEFIYFGKKDLSVWRALLNDGS